MTWIVFINYRSRLCRGKGEKSIYKWGGLRSRLEMWCWVSSPCDKLRLEMGCEQGLWEQDRVCVCICVCMCIYLYTCMCVHMAICTCLYVQYHVYLYMYMCMHIHVCTCICVWVIWCMCVKVYGYVMSIRMHVCMCVFVQNQAWKSEGTSKFLSCGAWRMNRELKN